MAIKIRRGLEADRTSVIFEEGEVLYTTDTKSFFIGDGVTAGGNQIGGTTAAELLKTEVHNATGATLTAGQVVYLSGNTGNKPNAVLAKADAEATSSKTIGLIILNIANNANGDIATDGLLSDIDTSAFAPGDLLWLSDSIAGGVTTVAPDTPNHAVFIGYVVAAHPTQGKILIHIQNGYELNELHDVKITSVANGDGLIYDSTLGYWKNSAEFTTQGNTFNAANKLVQLDATAKLPAVDGSQLTNLPTPSTPTLAQVTTAGNTTTNAISVGGLTVNLPVVSDTSYLKITSATANTFNTYIGTTAVNQYAWFTNIRYNGTAFVRDNTTYTAWRMNQVVGNSAVYDTFNLDHWSTTGVNSTLLTVFGWTGNVGINTTTDAGYKLDVNGTVRIQGDISLITKDANSNTRLQVSNISTGSQASAEFWLTSNGGTASWSKFSSNRTTYKIQKANDAGLYNGTAGDIIFLNDVSTGKILFSAGGSATAQVTLFSNGNVGINTTTDAGYKLDVNGTVRVQNGLDVNNQAITNIGALSNSSNLRLDASGTIGVIRIGANQVGIGNNSIGDTSAILTLISTTRGFLPPRMTTTQKNAISTPAAGLVVYDTTLNKLCVYTSAWETITSI